MAGDVLAHEEHGKVVREVVAVVEEQVIRLFAQSVSFISQPSLVPFESYLCRVHLLQALQILEDDIQRKISLPHGYNLHRPPMVSSARIRRLNSSSKEILYPPKDDRGMVDGIDVDSEKASRHLPGQTLWALYRQRSKAQELR